MNVIYWNYIRGPLRSLTAAKNANFSWLLNFRARVFLKSTVNYHTHCSSHSPSFHMIEGFHYFNDSGKNPYSGAIQLNNFKASS